MDEEGTDDAGKEESEKDQDDLDELMKEFDPGKEETTMPDQTINTSVEDEQEEKMTPLQQAWRDAGVAEDDPGAKLVDAMARRRESAASTASTTRRRSRSPIPVVMRLRKREEEASQKDTAVV